MGLLKVGREGGIRHPDSSGLPPHALWRSGRCRDDEAVAAGPKGALASPQEEEEEKEGLLFPFPAAAAAAAAESESEPPLSLSSLTAPMRPHWAMDLGPILPGPSAPGASKATPPPTPAEAVSPGCCSLLLRTPSVTTQESPEAAISQAMDGVVLPALKSPIHTPCPGRATKGSSGSATSRGRATAATPPAPPTPTPICPNSLLPQVATCPHVVRSKVWEDPQAA